MFSCLKSWIGGFIFNFISLTILAQIHNVYPKTGTACPDFTLKNIVYFKKPQASSSDFRGKWLILDFWTSRCASCIESFPHTNKLRQEFKDKVEFMLIGLDDKHIRSLYERVKSRYNLDLPVAYDTTLFTKFGVPSVPHLIWIDDKGVVQAITGKEELSSDNIRAFLAGKKVSLPEKINIGDKEKRAHSYDYTKPFLIKGNGGNDTAYMYRSILADWKPSMGVIVYDPDYFNTFIYPNQVLVIGIPLINLYEMAYGDTIPHRPLLFNPPKPNNYGKYWIEPILEVKDQSPFKFDYSLGLNLFSYNLTVPPVKANKRYLQEIMQRDLQNYFGYIVKIEDRVMPCWKLIADKNVIQKFKSKGGTPKLDGDGLSGQVFINQPISAVISILWGQNQNEPPIFDETGLDFNVDLTIDAILHELGDVKNSLRKSGLDLVKGEKKMKVIVISDHN
jgi:thiol-disulfide isomerase/thioredoxin